MEATIEHRPVFTTLTINLAGGESIRAESGAMVSMSPGMELEAKTSGKGILGTVKAAVGGAGAFASLYTAPAQGGELILSPTTLGDVVEMSLNGETILAQAGSYLAGSTDLELSTQGSLKAMVGGEGLFLQQISGTGPLYLGIYGAVFVPALGAGEHYTVDTGHVVAFEQSVTFKLRKASRGIFSTLASGEGLVSDFEGPGKLWIQSRNLKSFAELVMRFAPKS